MSVPKVLEDTALEQYYQSLFHMYGGPGWKSLMEDIGRMLEIHNTVNGIDAESQLFFRKGELAQMQWLHNHQAMVESAYSSMLAAQEGGDEEAPTGGQAKAV